MNRQQALEELQQCIENNDTEIAHAIADQVLMTFLIDLGYQDVVDKYDQVSKWYA